MADLDQISDAARQSIVAQAVPLLPRSAVGLGGAGQKFVLGSTIREEMLGLDGVQAAGGAAPKMTGQTLSTLRTVTPPGLGGGPPAVVGYVRATVPAESGLGAAPSATTVTAVSSSDLGARIEAAIDWIDGHVQGNPLVRVLTVPAYQVTALSVYTDGKLTGIVVVTPPQGPTQIQTNELYSPEGFQKLLQAQQPALGITR